MKIQRFVTWTVLTFFLIIGILSVGFFHVERSVTLRYLVFSLNQNLYDLEEEIADQLEQGRPDRIQSLLDHAAAIDDAIASVSVSLDGKTVAVSSSRSRTGTLIGEGYRPIERLAEEMVEENRLRYISEIEYFGNGEKAKVQLLIDLNGEFIFGRLNHIALIYGTLLFVVLAVFAIAAFMAVRRWLVRPLEEIAADAVNQKEGDKPYFIEEISSLRRTLVQAFGAMRLQQQHLSDALEETRYLDGILRTVADINQLLLTARTKEELMDQSCRRLSQHPGYELCHIAIFQNPFLSVKAFSNDPGKSLYPGMLIGLEDVSDPSVRAFTQNTTIVIRHLEAEKSLGNWYFIAEKGGYRSLIAIPLVASAQGEALGVITLYVKHDRGFESKEVAMLEELAGDIGFAVESFRQREQLNYHLTTDPTTDLPNRFSLAQALDHEAISGIAIINIDRFSDINEVYGVAIGDAILSGYGHWLAMKIAPHKEQIGLYKMGSDEYALVFFGEKEVKSWTFFLEGLIHLTQKESFMVEGIEIVLTVTIGVAPASEWTLEDAMAALKQAKVRRHSLEFFSHRSKREQENNIAWYKRIKEAIEESRIVPYYQPIVDNTTREVIKYEALIRLIDVDGKIISPFHFLEIAKKTKLYPELTKIMIEKVIEEFRYRPISVSLNLSTQDLINAELADFLEEKLQENKMASHLIFEILESEGIQNYADVSAFVERFKAIGCHFAIDDFGSGYSNFDHLLKLNIDTIKIDGGLIKNLPSDPNARIFVRHIADFARETGMKTVAEFVADEEIFRQVLDIGIDASQGYYFYEPSALPLNADV